MERLPEIMIAVGIGLTLTSIFIAVFWARLKRHEPNIEGYEAKGDEDEEWQALMKAVAQK